MLCHFLSSIRDSHTMPHNRTRVNRKNHIDSWDAASYPSLCNKELAMRYTKFLSIGPGGKKCVCCFPAPGKRKETFRSAKRKELEIAKKDMVSEMSELLNVEENNTHE